MFFGLSDRCCIFALLSAVFLTYSGYVWSIGTSNGTAHTAGQGLTAGVLAGYQVFQDKIALPVTSFTVWAAIWART